MMLPFSNSTFQAPAPLLEQNRRVKPSVSDSTRTANATRTPRKGRLRFVLLLLPLLLYVAALNPFFSPGTYDDVVYYFGAVSLSEDGTFQFRNKPITDWPPGTSALLAVPFALGLDSVWTGKICILLCAVFALPAAFWLFKKEARPFPTLTLVVFALLPCSFMMGTRIMSEWPYFLCSVVFLNQLGKLRQTHSLGMAMGVGVLLGIASLTKFTGVLLGAAVLAQMISKQVQIRDWRPWRAALPEILVIAIGASFFLSWKLKVYWQIQAGLAPGYDYYRAGLAPIFMGWPDPASIPAGITDLLFHSKAAAGFLGYNGWIMKLACLVPGVVVLLGMVLRMTSKERSPADWYVLSLLIAFSLFEGNRQTRYLFPIAPFLIGYGFIGARWLAHLFRKQKVSGICIWFPRPMRIVLPAARTDANAGVFPGTLSRRLLGMFAAGWILLLIGAAGQLLFRGNLSGTHHGMCYLLNHRPEAFYSGFWLDLYQACQHINRTGNGNVAVKGDEDKYVTAFLERSWTTFESAKDFAFVLVLDGAELARQQPERFGLKIVKRQGPLALYQRTDSTDFGSKPLDLQK